jgi:hypothetical protein
MSSLKNYKPGAGSMVQVVACLASVRPEFNPQYCQKEKKKGL